MSHIISFLQNNFDKVWTLVATLIGAYISYQATIASEQHKEKRMAQREKLKDVLIPLCCSLEDVIEIINQYNSIDCECFDIKLKAPSEYLKAEKRVYLSEKQRSELKDFDMAVQSFYKIWQDEQKSVLIQYKQLLAQHMKNCPDAPDAMDIDICLKMYDGDLRASVLEKKVATITKYVTRITYIINDDPENFRDFSVDFNEEIKNLSGQIDRGIINIDDVGDLEKQISCKIYAFAMSIDNKLEAGRIMYETKTYDNLLNLATRTKTLRDNLLKDIDKIAR